MGRLTQLDIPERIKGVLPETAGQLLFGVVCSFASIGLRLIIDIWLPGAGPFAVTMPFVLIATLFGRWGAGIVCLTIAALHAWYFVLPIEGSFRFELPSDGPRVFVNIAAGAFVVALAEIFRRAVRRAIADRDMLMLELEHRVKNNFAAIASMLRLQMRSASDEETIEALRTALGRVESYARAHNFLYRDFNNAGTVDMRDYLTELCRTFADSLGKESRIRIVCEAEKVRLPRDRAVTIGLLINEVATNSVKHAFPANGEGQLRVHFEEDPQAYRLHVADNGRGMETSERAGSIGMPLIKALTQQARGSYAVDTGPAGTDFRFEFAR